MTPDRLRERLALLRWSQRGLAEALEVDARQVRYWANGAYAVPPPVAAWLEVLAAAHAANPLPPRPARQPRPEGEAGALP